MIWVTMKLSTISNRQPTTKTISEIISQVVRSCSKSISEKHFIIFCSKKNPSNLTKNFKLKFWSETLYSKFYYSKLQIWSFTFLFAFLSLNHTLPLWFINIFSFIVLILKKIISHKYFKFCLHILSFTHKIK